MFLVVGSARGEATSGVRVPQRDGWEIFEQQRLSLVVLLSGLFLGGGLCSLNEQLVELFVGVVTVVRGTAGLVQRSKEVAQGWVVCLPTGTESGLDGAVGYLVTQGLEVWVRSANGLDAQGVLDGVGHCINPALVATVRVVGNLEGWGSPLVDLVSLSPQLLSLLWVVLHDFVALDVLGVTRENWGGEVLGRSASALEDGLGDLLAVDCVGDGLAAQLALFTGEVLEVLADGEGLEASVRLVDCTITLSGLTSCSPRPASPLPCVGARVPCETCMFDITPAQSRR